MPDQATKMMTQKIEQKLKNIKSHKSQMGTGRPVSRLTAHSQRVPSNRLVNNTIWKPQASSEIKPGNSKVAQSGLITCYKLAPKPVKEIIDVEESGATFG